MNTFSVFQEFIKRSQFLSIRNAIKKEITFLENKGELSKDEIEQLWQLRDFVEIFNLLVRPQE